MYDAHELEKQKREEDRNRKQGIVDSKRNQMYERDINRWNQMEQHA